jgi:hypothetical protein
LPSVPGVETIVTPVPQFPMSWRYNSGVIIRTLILTRKSVYFVQPEHR